MRLHSASRRLPAKVGDKLVATGEPEIAIRLLPGTEPAFETEVQYDRAFSLFGKAFGQQKVALFRQINCPSPRNESHMGVFMYCHQRNQKFILRDNATRY